MSFTIDTAFVKQFGSNIYTLAQQKGSRLRGSTRTESQKGEEKFFERLGPTTAVERTTRHGDTPLVSSDHSRRRVTLTDYEWADLIDDQDKVRMLIDPTSEYVQSAMNALGRAMDDKIITAALGNASAGKEGATTVAHPNTQKLVAVDGVGSAKMSVSTLRAIRRKFWDADVDESIPLHIAVSGKELQDLLADTELTSSDFATVKALVNGEINSYMGFMFHRTQRLNSQSGALLFDVADGSVGAGAGDADGYLRTFAWAQDGIILSIGEDMQSRISERDDKSYATQVYAKMSIGAVRMEEVKVVECLVDPAA